MRNTVHPVSGVDSRLRAARCTFRPCLRSWISVLSPALAAAFLFFCSSAPADDYVAEIQSSAMNKGSSALGHWGTDTGKYSDWTKHSNRLVPIYTYGTAQDRGRLNLQNFAGENSPYRSAESVRRLYGRIPERTVDENAVWMDQTDVAQIQRIAAELGRRNIFLVIFDGMDWETTRAAAIFNEQAVTYTSGRGSGTHFQNYTAQNTSQFAFCVSSPHNNGTVTDPNSQVVTNPGGVIPGGYDAAAGGRSPWEKPADSGYLIESPRAGNVKHAFTDSAAAATSMMAGIKTYYNAVGVDQNGTPVSSIAHELQDEGWAVGVVTSVPISHATPAAAYAHNVTRKDFQDLSRDMLGLASVSHPEEPLPGLDVVVGGGYGCMEQSGSAQGDNFVRGNMYLTDADLRAVSVQHGGDYVTALRTEGRPGNAVLLSAARRAADGGHRLLGFFGLGQYEGHIPWQTANGDYRPVKDAEEEPQKYSQADIHENPTLAEMTSAALTVLESRGSSIWLMVEAGDVDWANHDNNIDNAIGAVNSGDAAVKVITDWVEKNSNWDESLMIVTADHGHLFQFIDPTKLIQGTPEAQ